jgi:hypothetical protein
MGQGLLIGLLVLLVNSSWVVVFDDPSIGYLVGLAVHFALGLLLTVLFLVYLRRVWAQWSALGRWSAGILLLSGGLGVLLLLFGASRPWVGFGAPIRWAGPAHAILGTLGVVLLLGWLASQPWFYHGLGVATPSHHMALLLFLLISPVFTFLLRPLLSGYARKNEFEADAYAAAHASSKHLVEALVKLYRDNASTLTPDPLHSAFYDSHPPASIRIAKLEAF